MGERSIALSKNKLIIKKNKGKTFMSYIAWLIFIPMLLNFMNTAIIQFFAIESTSGLTLIIYAVTCLYGLRLSYKNKGISLKTLMQYMGVMFLFTFFYIIFGNARQYLLSIEMLSIYFIYLPISIFVIPSINSWMEFFERIKPFTIIGIVMAVLTLLFLDYQNIGYMNYSYALLPLVCASYCITRKEGNILNILVLMSGVFCMLAFGSRATFMFMIMFLLLAEVLFIKDQSFSQNSKRMLIFLIIILLVILLWDYELIFLNLIEVKYDARFLTFLTNNNLFEDTARNNLYNYATQIISNMGLKIYGPFVDRYFFEGYVHNIVYEVLLSFGWIFGIIFLGWITYKMIRPFIKTDISTQILACLFIASYFGRYLVSGSFIDEGRFYLFLAIMMSLTKTKKQNCVRGV